MLLEEDEPTDAEAHQDTFDSTASVRGSDAIGIGANQDALHSTVIIKSSRIAQEEDDKVPPGAPPAYSGTVRSSRRASYASRTNVEGLGTVITDADLGNGVDTIRPVKKVDPVGSLRLSAEFVGNMRKDGSGSSPSSPTAHKRAMSEAGRAGRSLVDEVILPVLGNHLRDDMDAREIESLSMLHRGFTELKEANPELTYNIILDLLQGINDNPALRQHIQTSSGLFPHKRIIRKSEMTSKGLVVTEDQEIISGLPSSSETVNHLVSPLLPQDAPSRKSPIAELLYLRWLEGLKIKWPNIMSS
jgi:serine/threonine-protein kinase 24/25/MST4